MNQIGFTKGKRTSDHIFVLNYLIKLNKRENKPLYACFVDLRKCFDTLWRDGIFYKMLKNGLSTKFVQIIMNLYSRTKSRVKLKDGLTEYFSTLVGTRQGCNLSPSLFNIYINDLFNDLSDPKCDPLSIGDTLINVFAFADDLVLLSNSPKGLQHCLDLFGQYCTKWKLVINMTKTKILVFNTRRSGHSFYIYNQIIPETNKYTYLGIDFKKDGSLSLAMKVLNSKALKAKFAIKQGFQNANVKILLKLFDSLVKPISIYGSEIWALDAINWQKDIDKLMFQDSLPFEQLQNRFCKAILKVNSKCPNVSAKGELGRYPIIISIFVSMIKYWVHARQSDKNSLIYKATSCDLQNKVINYKTLIDKILGKNLDFDKLPVKTVNREVKQVKKQLQETYVREFFKVINCNDGFPSKFREYRKVKKVYNMENYLKLNEVNRNFISKIRLSCHHFPIEIGRWKKIDKTKRFCFYCNTTDIGDECHVLFHCTSQQLVAERHIFVNKLKEKNDQFCKLDNDFLYLYTLLGHDKSITKISGDYFRKICDIAYIKYKNMSTLEMSSWVHKCKPT